MENDNDISVGKDQWIKWIELDHEKPTANIDSNIELTKSFWTLLETECVSACCGIDAYALWGKDIRNAKKQLNDPNISSHFEQLKTNVLSIDTQTISSTYLNNLFDKTVFTQLLDHIISNLK